MDDNVAAALRRKLRALRALAENPGASAGERAAAAGLRQRLEARLRQTDAPAGDWSDIAFRLGRRVKDARNAASPDWTERAHKLGKAFGRTYRKWSSE